MDNQIKSQATPSDLVISSTGEMISTAPEVQEPPQPPPPPKKTPPKKPKKVNKAFNVEQRGYLS